MDEIFENEFNKIIKGLKTHPQFSEQVYFLSKENMRLFALGFYKIGQQKELNIIIKQLQNK